MHISLTPELEGIVKGKVGTGLYNNASEVIREALRFMEMNQDIVYHMKLNQLRTHLAASGLEIDQGQGIVLKNSAQVEAFFEDVKG